MDYELITEQLKGLMESDRWYVPVFSNASAILFNNMEKISWAGFYVVRNDELVLGPFQGKVACIHIPFNKGVCGAAYSENKTMLVKNVNEFPGHIACDSASKSEIVVPVRKDGKVVAVLDIDSPVFERFDENDRAGLEKFVREIENNLEF